MVASPPVRIAARLPYRLITRLPARLAVPVLAHRNRRRSDTEGRVSHALDDRIRVDAYWLRFDQTQGPALSVFFDDEELFRVDGLVGQAHLHYCLAESRVRQGRSRIELPPSNMTELLDRMVFELQHNLGYSLHLHRRRAVQRHEIDQARLAEIAASTRVHLVELIERHRDEIPHTARQDEDVRT